MQSLFPWITKGMLHHVGKPAAEGGDRREKTSHG
jgi:hypothetical protein